jgi:heptosyltransferase-1
VAKSSDGTADAVAASDLAFLATFLRRAALVMGGDTGPVHLAHALGTPVLCLMGPTDPQRNGPYRDPEAALWRQLPCSFCHQRFAESKLCLLDLSPQEVADKARWLLDRASGNRPA